MSLHKKKVHFIGILGSGMSSLAAMALKLGYEVQGSDLGKTPHHSILDGCVIKDSQIKDGWRPAQIVVYSSAIPRKNPELASARMAASEGILVLHRSEFLQHLMLAHTQIIVSGTHGKSTTSALLTHIFDDLSLDPLSVIGAQMARYQASIRYGKGNYFIAEADESDGTLLNYQPFVGVVTNIDVDHLDFYGSFGNIVNMFDSFIDKISPDGFAALFWDNEPCRNLFRKKKREFVTFGFNLGSEIRALDISQNGLTTHFKAVIDQEVYQIKIPLLGKHNILNSLASLSVVHGLKLDLEKAIASLSTFKGVQRRLNLTFENELIRIFDDYAHNPGKMSACIASLKEAFPMEPLIIVFQAHRYSRLQTMYVPMLESLKSADYVIVAPVFAAGEPDISDFSPNKIAFDIEKLCYIRAIPVSDQDQIPEIIEDLKLGKITVLTCGAGDIYKVGQKIAAKYISSHSK